MRGICFISVNKRKANEQGRTNLRNVESLSEVSLDHKLSAHLAPDSSAHVHHTKRGHARSALTPQLKQTNLSLSMIGGQQPHAVKGIGMYSCVSLALINQSELLFGMSKGSFMDINRGLIVFMGQNEKQAFFPVITLSFMVSCYINLEFCVRVLMVPNLLYLCFPNNQCL